MEYKLWSFIILVGLFILVLFGPVYIVPAGYRGVLLTFGKADEYPKGEGLGFKFPFIQSVVKMEVRTQKYEADATAASKDLQIVTAKIATNYRLVPGDVVKIYNTLGESYPERIIQPLEQEVVKATTAMYTAEELITRREEVRQEIKRLLTERLAERGIIVEEISITNFDFSESFNNAIEAKVVQLQNSETARNKMEQIKFEAQQRIIEAQGKANATYIEAKALRENPDILQLRAIERWDGRTPLVVGGVVPFLSLDSIIK